MKAKELLEVLKDKEDFEVELYELIGKEGERPISKRYKLQLSDIGYSEKVIVLEKVNS